MEYSKELTSSSEIQNGPEPDEVIIPLSQHIGAPCQSIVEVGSEILVGQKIAEAEAFVTAPIHSSVSGKVKSIGEKPHPNGSQVMSITIENDKKYTGRGVSTDIIEASAKAYVDAINRMVKATRKDDPKIKPEL